MNHGVGMARVPREGWCHRCVEDPKEARWEAAGHSRLTWWGGGGGEEVGLDTSHAHQMLEAAARAPLATQLRTKEVIV